MRLKLLVLLLCLAFSVAEILGPDAAQSESKTEEEEDDDDPLVTTKKDIDADEYLKNLNKVVSEQIKQFNEYVGAREPLDKGKFHNDLLIIELIYSYKLLLQNISRDLFQVFIYQ